MSPILLQTFVEAIEGSYDVSNYQQKVLKLKVGSARVEFEFTVCAEEESKSPLVQLQNLRFNEMGAVQLDLLQRFKLRMQEINAQDDQVICLDLLEMAKELLRLVDNQLKKLGKKLFMLERGIYKQT